jgi:hypothetical protein
MGLSISARLRLTGGEADDGNARREDGRALGIVVVAHAGYRPPGLLPIRFHRWYLKPAGGGRPQEPSGKHDTGWRERGISPRGASPVAASMSCPFLDCMCEELARRFRA